MTIDKLRKLKSWATAGTASMLEDRPDIGHAVVVSRPRSATTLAFTGAHHYPGGVTRRCKRNHSLQEAHPRRELVRLRCQLGRLISSSRARGGELVAVGRAVRLTRGELLATEYLLKSRTIRVTDNGTNCCSAKGRRND